MTIGTVTEDGEVIVWVRVFGPWLHDELAAVLDTGYDGWLSLPPANIAALGLAWQDQVTVTLADGSKHMADLYLAEVEWAGERRWTRVTAVEGDILLGTALLFGHELRAAFTPGGSVELRPLG